MGWLCAFCTGVSTPAFGRPWRFGRCVPSPSNPRASVGLRVRGGLSIHLRQHVFHVCCNYVGFPYTFLMNCIRVLNNGIESPLALPGQKPSWRELAHIEAQLPTPRISVAGACRKGIAERDLHMQRQWPSQRNQGRFLFEFS